MLSRSLTEPPDGSILFREMRSKSFVDHRFSPFFVLLLKAVNNLYVGLSWTLHALLVSVPNLAGIVTGLTGVLNRRQSKNATVGNQWGTEKWMDVQSIQLFKLTPRLQVGWVRSVDSGSCRARTWYCQIARNVQWPIMASILLYRKQYICRPMTSSRTYETKLIPKICYAFTTKHESIRKTTSLFAGFNRWKWK
jgi:hypothetical protein